MGESLNDIKKMVCKGLDMIAEKGVLNDSNLDAVDKLTHTLKSIETIMAMQQGGYSNDYSNRRYSMDSHYGNSYTGGSNSNNGGGSYDLGHYSRDGHYLADQLRDMLNQANSERDRRALQDCITKMGG